MSEIFHTYGTLTGKLLVATPYLKNQQLHHSVIYICGHDEMGAMGLIINQLLSSVNFKDLLDQIKINYNETCPTDPIYYGGPVDGGRGFVLHTKDYFIKASVVINNNFVVTTTREILRDISKGHGPQNALVTLGYVSWDAFQLEKEIQHNNWFVVEANEDLIFTKNRLEVWHDAMISIGIDPNHLACEIGHA